MPNLLQKFVPVCNYLPCMTRLGGHWLILTYLLPTAEAFSTGSLAYKYVTS